MSHQANAQFRATTGSLQEFGATPQEALGALMQRLPNDAVPTIMILPYNREDACFADAEQTRLQELKSRLEGLTQEHLRLSSS